MPMTVRLPPTRRRIAPVLLLLLAAGAGAETVTVSPRDSLQAALDAAAAGDVIVLGDGTYHGAITIRKPLTLRAANGGKATVTNRHAGPVLWRQAAAGSRIWWTDGITWPVHGMRVQGEHAFDYRSKANFDARRVGPHWSKGWQAATTYTSPPISFAHDAATSTLWLRLPDGRDPNAVAIDFNGPAVDGRTLVQKDLGTWWNQQQIAVIARDPPQHPLIQWYGGTPDAPTGGETIDFPKLCGIVITVAADDVRIEGLRVAMGPTVGIEVNDSKRVTITDCLLSGFQFGINTGYRCTDLTVLHCEFDGGRMVTAGRHTSVSAHMWNHCTYIVPVKFNGTGLVFQRNYVYEGFDLFHPRGRHKDYPEVPDLRSDVGWNVWQNATDNALEFDAVEARMNLRFHHNLVLQDHDALAITTTEDGGPLTIDHNLWWPGGGRIMKLNGTGRTNRGVHFVHNTYFTGKTGSANVFADSLFENNLVISGCTTAGAWSSASLGSFLPTPYNLLRNGQAYAAGFQGLTADPQLGQTPATRFLLQPGSPAIDAGIARSGQHQEGITGARPDLGAIEAGRTIDDWRAAFGRPGPRWITDPAHQAPMRPAWPAELDPRWGGLEPLPAGTAPLVAIAASDAGAAEGGGGGAFTVTRTGSTAASLAIAYTVGGTATAGSDYTALSGSLLIPAGAASATVAVAPLDDGHDEPDESVIASLVDGAAYDLGSPASATVVIGDDDTAGGGPFAVRINFQPVEAPTVDGWLVDAGAVFAPRAGHTYGWTTANDSSRDRNHPSSPDQLHDTLIHLQKKATGAVWEIAVPAGTYAVRLVCGDADFQGSRHVVEVEGATALNAVTSAAQRWVEGTATVTVGDGRLTVRPGPGAENAKLCFLEIIAVAGNG